MMKFHDCHVLMTSVLPVAIRNVLLMNIHETVTSLCFFFNAIEQNVIDDELLTSLDRRLHETMLASTNVTNGKAAMTPADANFGWQYFMNHE